ncbi:DUF5327 family protein [Staphylococcus equorum]|uniref:DUF5327 family protein n=1 Tax=Staphylococcus equorum TaxID=246432 RepID=UPI000852FE05|nr:DUF5327 family protein [Staphylococcus equorum]MCE5006546.1 DUF5327 family protein [Staphylococcus equorum]MCE5047770.1 DUF5327 family protein [Staphylococcus equorum]MEB7715652.1 YwdI family protein [Staphylococcus equorum]MEB7747094.1 YwdI family protein [Staphylococcus equorum]MEB7758709.1 YwdI family protein [Staphylococcus equorum]
MEKDKVIQLIEQELVAADEANNNAEFEKHIYAIHTLTSLVTESTSQHKSYKDNTYDVSSSFQTSTIVSNGTSKPQSTSKKPAVSEEEIRAMGGKTSQPAPQNSVSDTSLTANKLVTDDEIGNGDSIFDF